MKTWMKAAGAACVAASLATIAARAVHADQNWRMNQIETIRELALRDEMKVYDKGHPGKDALYFLSIGDGIKHPADPPDELMAKFTGDQPAYEPASAAEIHDNFVQDAKTLKHGTLFWATGFWWMGDKQVDVDCGYFNGGLITDNQTKRFVYQRGSWKIINRTPALY